jgi:hypothetical protein
VFCRCSVQVCAQLGRAALFAPLRILIDIHRNSAGSGRAISPALLLYNADLLAICTISRPVVFATMLSDVRDEARTPYLVLILFSNTCRIRNKSNRRKVQKVPKHMYVLRTVCNHYNATGLLCVRMPTLNKEEGGILINLGPTRLLIPVWNPHRQAQLRASIEGKSWLRDADSLVPGLHHVPT